MEFYVKSKEGWVWIYVYPLRKNKKRFILSGIILFCKTPTVSIFKPPIGKTPTRNKPELYINTYCNLLDRGKTPGCINNISERLITSAFFVTSFQV